MTIKNDLLTIKPNLMKKKILMILPLFLMMFFAGQIVQAQSFVSSTEALTILQTEYASAKTDLEQATPGTDQYKLAETQINYYASLVEVISEGSSVEDSLNKTKEKMYATLGTQTRRSSSQASNLKLLFNQSRSLLEQ